MIVKHFLFAFYDRCFGGPLAIKFDRNLTEIVYWLIIINLLGRKLVLITKEVT